MARARGLLLLLTAARSAYLHAADCGAPAAASIPFFTQAAASGAPAAACRGFSTRAAASSAPATVYRGISAPAAASSAPAAASEALLVSAVEPVGYGGYGRQFRRLGYGALATYVGAIIMTSCAPVTEWDLVHEELEADYLEADAQQKIYRMRMHFAPPRGRPPSSREVRQNTEMLKAVNRRLKDLEKKNQKEQSVKIETKQPDWFWDGLEDLITKGKALLSAVNLIKGTLALSTATVTGCVYLHEKFGDPVQYFVCPYSGHTEVAFLFLFRVKPNDESKQGDGSSGGRQKIMSSNRTNIAGLEAMGVENILGALCCLTVPELTIGRPFNWIGPRMDFIRHVDGPSEGARQVFSSFRNILLRTEPLKLVDGGEAQRTFVYIKDGVEAVLMIENPARANGHIFNVGYPNNEFTVMELAEMMTEVYANVSRGPALEESVIAVSEQQVDGEGYDDRDERIPDMTLINKQLGWSLMTSLKDLLEKTLTYLHKTYKEAVKMQMSQASASS